MRRLDAADVPCMPVLARHETLTDPQVVSRDLIATMVQPGVGNVRQARPAARFSETPAHAPRPAPKVGEDTAAILSELGFDETAVAELRTAGVLG